MVPVLALITALASTAAPVQPWCDEVTLVAAIADDLRTAHGTLHCTTQKKGTLWIASYPRLLREPRGLDDVSRVWNYPKGFDPADMHLADAHGKVFAGTGPWQLWGNTASGENIRVSFQTQIPRRHGTFGRRGKTAYLLGGWHPVLGDGERLDQARITYRIRIPANTVGFVGRDLLARSNHPQWIHGTFVGEMLPMLLAPTCYSIASARSPLSPQERFLNAANVVPPWHLQELGVGDETHERREVRRTLRTGLLCANRADLSIEQPLWIVRTPLLQHFAESFSGGIALTERAFHLMELERLRKFHRVTTWRVVSRVATKPNSPRHTRDTTALGGCRSAGADLARIA
ncbi:MAG: hypothetical protein R3C68_07885 [Myxococcota bacterium]